MSLIQRDWTEVKWLYDAYGANALLCGAAGLAIAGRYPEISTGQAHHFERDR